MHNPNENHIGLLCTDGSWAVNDTGIYYPAGGLPFDNESIQSNDSGRTEDGTMHIDWVAGKVKIFMKWARLTGHEVKHLKELVFMKEFDFHFVDLGDRMTAHCYVSKMSYEKLSEDDGFAAEGGVYEQISANFIEIGGGSMYQVSNDIIKLIESRSRKIEWEGTITLTDNSEIAFNRRNINEGTGSLNLSCAPNNEATWGNAYLGELVLDLTDIGAERTRLQDAIINLYFHITGESLMTWGEASAYTWDDLSDKSWKGLLRTASIPMGLFIVSESMRNYGSVKVRAYDNMRKFDKTIVAIDEQARTPYQWLVLACSTCGVVLGMTYSQVFGLPNGRRLVKYAGTDNTIKTWRDLLSAVCAIIGGNAVIDRNGALIVRPYNDIIVDVISPGKRYSSSFSDYESYYTGLRLSYEETGVQEYVTNAETTEEDTGLVYDLAYNPFMQITDGTTRAAMMQELIDRQSGLRYTPYRMTGPLNPLYDLMDTLFFSGNHAEDSTAPITSITYRIGGEMSLSCGGENPALMTAESKESKALEGMSSNSSYGEDLWMLMNNAPSGQSVTIAADTETLMGEILLYAKEVNSMVQITYTAAYNLSKTALVTVRLAVDEETVYTVEQNQFVGVNKITATTGHQFRGTGSHAVRAYLTVSEATIDIGGGGVLMSLDVTENGLYTAADRGVYGFSQVTATVDDAMGFYSSLVDATERQESASFVSLYRDLNDYEATMAVYALVEPQQATSYDQQVITVSDGRVEYIIADYSYTGSAATIDSGYLSECSIPTDDYSLMVSIATSYNEDS